MRRLLVDIPFAYIAEVIPPRHRNPLSYNVKDVVTVSLTEEDPSIFQVAFRYSLRDMTAYRGHEPKTDQMEDILWDGDRLFHRDTRFEQPSGTETVQSLLFKTGQASTPFSQAQRSNVLGQSRRLADVDGRIVSHNLEERRAAVIAVAMSSHLCDGQWLKRCLEPVWQSQNGDSYSITPVVAAKLLSPHDLKWPGNPLTRADSYEEALGWINDKERGRIRTTGAIEVLIPEAMTAPMRDITAFRQILALLGKQSKSLYSRPVEFLDAWVTLRDAVRNCGDRVSPAVSEATGNFIDRCNETQGIDVTGLERAYGLWLGWRDATLSASEQGITAAARIT